MDLDVSQGISVSQLHGIRVLAKGGAEGVASQMIQDVSEFMISSFSGLYRVYG